MESLLQPVGLAWLAAVLLVLRCLWRRQWREAGGALVVALVLWTAGGTPFGAWLLSGLERPYAAPTRSVGRADAVVMLGGTHSSTGQGWLPFNLGDPGDRVLVALEMVRLGKAGNLVLGGSYYEVGTNRRPDSELLVAWMQAWKLPTGRVHLLGVCADSHVEAERTAELARRSGWRRVIVVSSAAHLRRAEGAFRKAGLEVAPVGCEFIGMDVMSSKGGWSVVPRVNGFLLCNTWVHEQLGWWYYRLKGWA